MPIFASGTKTLFQQSSAPTGWTKDTTFNNAALRVISGSVVNGGTEDFTNVFTNHVFSNSTFPVNALGGFTLAWPNIAPHVHVNTPAPGRRTASNVGTQPGTVPAPTPTTPRLDPTGAVNATTGNSAGTGSNAHDHPVTATASGSIASMSVKYIDMILASKD